MSDSNKYFSEENLDSSKSDASQTSPPTPGLSSTSPETPNMFNCNDSSGVNAGGEFRRTERIEVTFTDFREQNLNLDPEMCAELNNEHLHKLRLRESAAPEVTEQPNDMCQETALAVQPERGPGSDHYRDFLDQCTSFGTSSINAQASGP
jgi:hypothetical protein